MLELTLVLVTVLLFPVLYFSSKWGFETLHQHYMAKVALTEFERRTRSAEDRAEVLKKSLEIKIEQLSIVQQDVESLKRSISSLETLSRLRK